MHTQPAPQAAPAPSLDTSRLMPRRVPPACGHVLAFALLRARPFKADEPATRRFDRFAVRRAVNVLVRQNILERLPGPGAALYRLAPLPAVALAAFRLLLPRNAR